MAQWGRNDQSVTANSSTTVETSTGAPIGTYTAVKAGGGANAHFGNTSAGSRAATDVNMFNNATSSAFLSGAAVGVFGVSAPEVANTSSEKVAHAGWNLRRAGTGPAVSAVYANTGVGYNNNDILVAKSSVAGGNATFNMTTNATGGAVVLTLNTAGFGFTGTGQGNPVIPTSNLFITNATGGSAAGNTTTTYMVVTAGGRAGRVHYENLVAMGSLGAQTAAYGTAATANDASTDDSFFPGT
jgi:hypothetical protein